MEFRSRSEIAELIAAVNRLVGTMLHLTLEVPSEGGNLAVRGILVSAFDMPVARREGNLTLMVGPHLVELRFGRIEHVQFERPVNGNGGLRRVRLFLEGKSVMELCSHN